MLFDYRTFGQSEGTPRNLADLASQLQDYRSALTWVRGQSAFDLERIVLFGAAFSGGHAVTVAAEVRQERRSPLLRCTLNVYRMAKSRPFWACAL